MDDSEQQPRIRLDAVPAAIHWIKNYTDGAVTLSEEIARFAHHRAEHTLESMVEVTTNLYDPAKAWEVQERWMRRAMHDYNQEMQRLFQIASEFMRIGPPAGK